MDFSANTALGNSLASDSYASEQRLEVAIAAITRLMSLSERQAFWKASGCLPLNLFLDRDPPVPDPSGLKPLGFFLRRPTCQPARLSSSSNARLESCA